MIKKFTKPKSKKLAKCKKLSKSRNSSKCYVKKARSSFLIADARTSFNHLWLVFTKALTF